MTPSEKIDVLVTKLTRYGWMCVSSNWDVTEFMRIGTHSAWICTIFTFLGKIYFNRVGEM